MSRDAHSYKDTVEVSSWEQTSAQVGIPIQYVNTVGFFVIFFLKKDSWWKPKKGNFKNYAWVKITLERSSSILKLSAFFGNGGTSEPLVSNGVPNLVLGIDGTTQCSAQPPEMPSTNIVHSNSLIAVGESIFSFGGKVPLIMSGVTDENFKYDIASNQWTQIEDFRHGRYTVTLVQLSEGDIFITG